MSGWSTEYRQRPGLFYLALFYAAYVLAGGFGQGLALIPGIGITFWPPAGIFVATLLLNARGRWPWYVLAGGLAELTCNVVWFHNPTLIALVYYGANVLEALTAAWLIERFTSKPLRLESLREVAAFVGLGAMVAPIVGATGIALTDAILGKHPFVVAWPLVWLGDGTGLLVSTPLTLVTVQAWRERGGISLQRLMEIAALVLILTSATALSLMGYLPTVYVALPVLLWAAVRFQLKGAAAALALTTLIGAIFTAVGAGEFSGQPNVLQEKIVMLQTFLGVSAISTLLVAALSEQHRQVLRKLTAVNSELEARVASRTADLQEREGQLRLFIENAPAAIAMFDRNMHYLAASQRWKRDYGLGDIDLLGRSHYAVFPEIPEDWKAAHRRGLAGEALRSDGERFDRGDGSIQWIKWDIYPWRTAGGDIGGILIATEDITERKHAEQRLQLLSGAAAIVLHTADPDTMIRALFAKIGPPLGMDICLHYGVKDSGEGVQLISCIGIATESAPLALHFGEALCGGAALYRGAIVVNQVQQSDDPQARAAKSLGARSYAAYPLMSGKLLLGTLSFASRTKEAFDADELTLLETICQHVAVAYERLRLVDKLRETDRRKDEFLATLAHELRNPLAPIRTALQLMRVAQAKPETLEQARSVIERQVEQMVRLVDDLLDVSRISRGKIELRRQPIELAGVLASAIETSRPLVEQMGHRLDVALPAHVVVVDADATRLAQVFLNLLSNAAKYTDRGGCIELTAQEQGNEAVVTVQDNGIGIPADKLHGLFEMFSQVEGTLSRAQGGLGIGLWLVKRLVQMHGGSVEVQSEGSRRGSRFVVRLPLAAQARPAPNMDRTAATENAFSKLRILVVDDNIDAAASLAMLLENMGNYVRTAGDGEEAVRAASEFLPDVVLLDIGLPKLNGYEACRRIRAQPWGKNTIVIAVTGWGLEEDRRKSSEAGFDQHLVKPVDPMVLMGMLTELSTIRR
ncbi:MAG TPA: MASE1 domain-containing protein [Burkholderiales bacterium]|nr:MASE1 domain-containing protein [Burkholderiales bacterium]